MKKPKFPIGPRIAALRAERGITQAALAEAAEMTQQGIQSIEAGAVKRPKQLREIAAALCTSEDYLLTGNGQKDLGDGFNEPDADYEPPPADGIREIDVRAGLGGGGTVDGRETMHDGQFTDPLKAEPWRFPSRFVREELRAPEERIIIMETWGDSMSPTILSGDRVIIDTTHRLPSPDGIYAVRDRYGNIVIKRLQLLRKGQMPVIKIISDNKAHEPEEVDADEIAIVGRVLWGLKRL